MTFTCPTTRHSGPILTVTLALLITTQREETATAPPSPEHSWQDHTASHQTK